MRQFIILLAFLLNFAFGIELLRLGEFKDQNVSGWLASEKLDGIRAYWDGQNLLSKNGVKFASPSEFVADFPPFALDGELFIGREKFELVQSVVMDKKPDILAWKDVKFYVFDVPDASGGLLSRLDVLQKFLQKQPNEKIKIIEQILIPDNAWLKIFISQIIKNGGEGAVLREANAPYERKRSQNALKLKPFFDTECEVVAINQGKGKYKNVMGSLVCKDLKSKKIFKIGSGFSDEMRKNPPKIGEIITYKYQNLTKNGLPRFPVFLRIRKD